MLASDKTISVISHLYSVGEAVNDVLWVEKTARESSAKWLTPQAREKLISDGIKQLQELI